MAILPQTDDQKTDHATTSATKSRTKQRVFLRGCRRLHNVQAARRSTMSIKAKKITRFSNKDFDTDTTTTITTNPDPDTDTDTLLDFIQMFVPDTSIEYSRLHIATKTYIAQYLMLGIQRQSSGLISTPFTIRLNSKQQNQADKTINRSMRREINKALGRMPLYWVATHRNRSMGKEGVKHYHAEFLITTEEIGPLKQAIKRLYGLKSDGIGHAVREHSSKRKSVVEAYGRLYAHLNWAGYGTCEIGRLKFGRRVLGLSANDNKNFCTISADLNSQAKTFYEQNIFRQFNYKRRTKPLNVAITSQILTQ